MEVFLNGSQSDTQKKLSEVLKVILSSNSYYVLKPESKKYAQDVPKRSSWLHSGDAGIVQHSQVNNILNHVSRLECKGHLIF